MPSDFSQMLSSVGLTPSEAKVYLAALALGPSTAQHIAVKANISRTATYDAIEMLQQRGLISAQTLGKRHVFSAEDPARIVSYLKNEQERMRSTLGDLERSVDALRLLSGGVRPTVKVYEGEEALFAYFDHVASVNPKEWWEMTNLDDVYQHIDEKVLLAARKAVEKTKGYNAKLLHLGKLRNPRTGAGFCEINKMFGDFHGNIAIYDDYVAFVTFVGKAVCVIIESPVIAQTMRMLYTMAWAANEKE